MDNFNICMSQGWKIYTISAIFTVLQAHSTYRHVPMHGLNAAAVSMRINMYETWLPGILHDSLTMCRMLCLWENIRVSAFVVVAGDQFHRWCSSITSVWCSVESPVSLLNDSYSIYSRRWWGRWGIHIHHATGSGISSHVKKYLLGEFHCNSL